MPLHCSIFATNYTKHSDIFLKRIPFITCLVNFAQLYTNCFTHQKYFYISKNKKKKNDNRWIKKIYLKICVIKINGCVVAYKSLNTVLQT